MSELGVYIIYYCGGHDCRRVSIKIHFFLTYLATGFQTHNKSIIGAIVSMYRFECLVVSSEKEGKGKF
jgi:hypothetical protein